MQSAIDEAAAQAAKASIARAVDRLDRNFSTADAVRVVLVCGCRDREQLAETLFNRRQKTLLSRGVMDACMPSAEEFALVERLSPSIPTRCTEGLLRGRNALQRADRAGAHVPSRDHAEGTLGERRRALGFRAAPL